MSEKDEQNPPGPASQPLDAASVPPSDLDVRIVRGNPTDEELAAVLAVIASLPPAPAHRPAPQQPAPTDWQRTQRPLRTTPLRHPWQ